VSQSAFRLIVRKGPQVGQVFHLDAPSHIVGRDPMSDITIGDPEISRQHARFTQTADGYQIEDLGSTNGTFVDGQRLSSDPFPLQPGQSINMGSGVRLAYEVVDTADPNLNTFISDDAANWASPPEKVVEGETGRFSPRRSDAPAVGDFLPPISGSTPDAYYPPVASVSSNNNRRNITIAIVGLLLLCCCCILFTWSGYYVWGDPLLELLSSMGIISLR